jgi:gag-polypeptide of LTR copia-type
MFHHVSTETNTKVLWDKLKNLYERKTTHNKVFIIRKLMNMKYTKSDTIIEYLSNF